MNGIDEVRYAIYARTAAGGPEQIEAQVRAARKAISRRLRTGGAVRQYSDVNAAGGPDGPLAGLAALLHDAASGLLDIVLVTDVTRLSRSAARLREILAALDAAGARLVCVGDPR